MHLYLNTAIYNTSLTLVTTGELTSPTFFESFLSDCSNIELSRSLIVGRLIETSPCFFTCQLLSKSFEGGTHCAKFIFLRLCESTAISHVFYNGREFGNIIHKGIIVSDFANHCVVVLKNVCMIKIHHARETMGFDSLPIWVMLKELSFNKFFYQFKDWSLLRDACLHTYLFPTLHCAFLSCNHFLLEVGVPADVCA
jgi:hypothetical protein